MAEPELEVHVFTPPERTLNFMLARQAERFGDRPFVTFAGDTWSFRNAAAAAAHSAASLTQAGVRRGDRVALICSNRLEFLEVMLGCSWIGAVIVPINVASRGPQLQHILSNSAASLLIVEDDLLGNLAHLDPSKTALQNIWVIGEPSKSLVGGVPVAQMPAGRDAVSAVELRPSDLFAILYTSGTTGPSKGVCCPHAQYYWWAFNSRRALQLRDQDVLSTTLPLFHNNALNTFYQALLLGARMRLEKRFSASSFFSDLASCQATVTYLLGAMVPILLSRPPSAADRDHKVRVALAPGVPARFHAEFVERTGIRLVEGWGSTETNFVIGTTADRQRPGLIGPVQPGFQARVVDDEDNEMPDGEPGELVVRADAPFAFATGYFAEPEKTVEAWRNLWFHTGDRVIRDKDGYFRFVDRLKDAIRRRGENVSSFEVEQVLLSHAAVANAAVYPVRSVLAEDEVMASVVLHSGHRITELELIKFAEPRLPYFAVPRFLEFVDTLPMTESGKVQKYKLTKRGRQPGTFDVEASGYKIKRR